MIEIRYGIYTCLQLSLDSVEKKLADCEEEERASTINTINELRSELEFWGKSLIELLPGKGLTDGVIDIRGPLKIKKSSDKYSSYLICLHGEKKIVGYIQYRGQFTGNCGDIEYSIIESFRGHGYAYRALSLLGDILSQNGINELWIAAENDNIASIKTIEKYGGTPIEMNPNSVCIPNVTLFTVSTKRIGDKPQIMQMNKWVE